MENFDENLSKWFFRAIIGFCLFLGSALVYLIIIMLIALTNTALVY